MCVGEGGGGDLGACPHKKFPQSSVHFSCILSGLHPQQTNINVGQLVMRNEGIYFVLLLKHFDQGQERMSGYGIRVLGYDIIMRVSSFGLQ